MNAIGEIFAGKPGEQVHHEFIKFSKGVFDNRYLIEAKKQKDGWTIKTGPEFVNSVVKSCLQKVKGEVSVTGVIVATFKMDLGAVPVERIKQFMGIKQSVINATVQPKDLLEAMEKYPRAFFALSFTAPGIVLKIKAKAPKSAKPAGSSGKEPKAAFCSIKTSEPEVMKELIFDVPDFKAITIKHTILIEDIILPTGVSDPVQIREQAKRKGKVKRLLTIDDAAQKVSEAAFLA